MTPIIPKTVLIDTGFWFGIYNSGDQYHKRATDIYNKIQNAQLLIPWPTLYEVLNSDFMDQKIWVSKFEILLKKNNIRRVDDSKYREQALIGAMTKSKEKGWKISLVDAVIREMLADLDMKIEYFVTFNEGDFSDILKKRSSIQFYYG